jgi:hypothetical protein
MLPILRMFVTDSHLRRSQDHSAAIGNFAGTRKPRFGSGLGPRFLTGDGGVELRSVVVSTCSINDVAKSARAVATGTVFDPWLEERDG